MSDKNFEKFSLFIIMFQYILSDACLKLDIIGFVLYLGLKVKKSQKNFKKAIDLF